MVTDRYSCSAISAFVRPRATAFLEEAGHDAIAVELPGDDETAGLPRICR